MRSIGLRIAPKEIFYSIVEKIDNDNLEILEHAKLTVPVALDLPSQLSFIRTSLFSIFLEYKVKSAGIRITEPSSKNLSINRLYIEGVVQELISNSTIEKYFAKAKTGIAGILGEEVTAISAYFDGNEDFLELKEWASISKETRESIVAAVAASCL